jgi:hypothetical protein
MPPPPPQPSTWMPPPPPSVVLRHHIFRQNRRNRRLSRYLHRLYRQSRGNQSMRSSEIFEMRLASALRRRVMSPYERQYYYEAMRCERTWRVCCV